MSTVDPRTPIIVGAGQFLQRPQDPTDALEPVEMMAEAVRRAAQDAGVAALAERADAIRVVKGAWPYHDPGRILADRLNASWYVVYIQTPREELHRIDAATQRRITNTLTLTQQLGGTPMTFKGGDVVSTIAAFAREYGITHIVLGRTRRPWYSRWFGQSVLDRLLQSVPEADVIVCGN